MMAVLQNGPAALHQQANDRQFAMDLITILAEYGPWSWVVGGMVLLAIELLVPGGIFIWLGAAAIAVGLITLAQPIGWPMQWLLFGALTIASIVAWLNFSRRRKDDETDSPLLNRRAARFIGREVALKDAINDGFGRVELGDTVWRVSGPTLDAGTKVRITGADGAVLTVEPI